ncbi:DUF5722 domain-containing protein [Cellulophaga sp. Hel_I_12]|uniref:DUF5722 domain-containing protein n=1 Tax=Cellulophaga sp. Hel_I_12 TaxID=1249972 RepID=UPI00068C0A96|nr:DUF5722 domain-containing protein [Cellulophaga sp. Hel_I_12]
MKKLLSILFVLPCFAIAQNASVQLSIDLDKTNDIKIAFQENEIYDITTTGKNPYVLTTPLVSKTSKPSTQLSFEYFCPTGVDFIKLHFLRSEKEISSKRIGDVGSTEGWVEFKVAISDALENWGEMNDVIRLDFGNAPDLKIQIKNLQIRALTIREKEIEVNKQAKKEEEAILEKHLKDYLSTNFQNKVEYVLATDKEIQIKGTVSTNDNYYLAEVSPYENVTELKAFEFIAPIKTVGKFFEMNIDRTIKRHGFNQDRALSKWVIVTQKDNNYQLASGSRYADSIVPKYTHNFLKPSTKKGLGGYSANRDAPMSDLDDLGITSATVNIWITHFFMSGPSPTNMPFEYMGKTYYVDKVKVKSYDDTLLSTAERNIEVSAILLVDKATKAKDKEIGRILQHPDCDPAGIYSMPNFTTPEGVQYYSAVLDFLANRYSRPDKKYGTINHYIIHNEVDAGWVWTNAGDKTALVFMDLYHKSMRMSHNIARKYNSNSKVFISLTHYWNWTSNPHFYHSKELLEQLLQFSKTEGDFEWAIAQHPYPESLREPKTWLDKKVSFDFDTQLITFKNTEVLDAWVKQPEVLFKGKTKRIVYLSENGTNSPTYSEQDLKEQAAGMAYALKKIKYLDGIDGFQYHNWQDNRREGGLRIGLRRFPDDEDQPGAIKPVWNVYQAFGTDQEDEVFDPYKKMIGIENWDEIRQKVDTGKKKSKP